jgi:hypothetical protein
MAQLKAIVDKLLTNVSSGYVPEGYISETIFPFVGVVQKTGKLGKYGLSHLRIENSRKAGRGAYRRVETITRSTTGYDIEGHGLEGVVTPDDYRNVEQPFDAERDETMGLTTALWLEKEKIVADALADTAVLTQNTTLSGTAQFSDYNNSDPVSVIVTGKKAVKAGCGLPPNAAILSWEVAETLRFHPQLLDMLGFKYARPGGLSDQELATVFGVQKILVGMAMYESAVEGQTEALSNIWGKHILLARLPDSAAVMQTSLGYRFGYAGQSPRQVYKYDLNNPPGAQGVLVEDNYDYVLSNIGAGYLIKNAIA